MTIHGSCLCRTLRYEIDPPFTVMMHCHCSMCRKHHGAPFATFAAAPLAQFRWLNGEDSVGCYASSPNGKRGFCRVCGSVAPMLVPEMAVAVLPAGTLDDDPGIRPQAHMFTGSKARWHTICDSLPQHDAFPPEFGTVKPVERASVDEEAGKTLGSCLCGDVAYVIEGEPIVMYQCHCSRCRKARGAAHGANLFYSLDKFHWLRGEERVAIYRPPEAQRFASAFCRQCGGAVPTVSHERRTVVAPAAALDTDPGMLPMAHIFVGSKAPWFEITDALPQIQERPPMPPQATAPR